MRKIYLSLLLIILIPLVSNAQFATSEYRYARAEIPNTRLEFTSQSSEMMAPQDVGTFLIGARLGFILQKMRSDYSDTKFRPGFVIGPDVMYYFTDQIVFMSGLLFNLGGTNFEDDYHISAWSLYIPLMVGYWVTNEWLVMAGFQPGFLLSVKDEEGDKITDFFKGFDFGIKFGVAYQITSQIIGRISYYNGFSNLYDGNIDEAALRSSILEFSASYIFHSMSR